MSLVSFKLKIFYNIHAMKLSLSKENMSQLSLSNENMKQLSLSKENIRDCCQKCNFHVKN